MPKVRPFTFAGLPKLTAEQVAVQESFATYLSYKPFQPDFGDSLGAVLERYFKVPCGVSAQELRPIARTELAALIPQTACLLAIGAAPSEHKILVELDMTLAGYAIDRLLGGAGDDGQILRPLTEIEEGVLSFVVLKVLQHLNTGWQNGQQLALSLDRFAGKLSDVQEQVDAVPGYHLVGVRVTVGRTNGYARIFLPQSLIMKSFASPAAQGPATAQELDYMRKLLPSLGELSVVGRVEAATLDLNPGDIASLEVGDIIILENHQLTKSANGLEGTAFVKLGTGLNGGIRGRLLNEGDQTRLEILEITIQEQPPEGAMVAEGDKAALGEASQGAEAPDNMAGTSGLLRDVPAPVVVELGRIRLNAAQVTRLRAGQIIRLPRGPNDPVDLVVNGKLFARGELIEVDGELGVRLQQVVGAG
jgi:type III secretion system YscQ/HrcQ family protein